MVTDMKDLQDIILKLQYFLQMQCKVHIKANSLVAMELNWFYYRPLKSSSEYLALQRSWKPVSRPKNWLSFDVFQSL